MAIGFDNLCVICDKEIEPGESNLSTSGCAFPQEHRLWKYCDAPMHVKCLIDWRHRKEFSEAYYKQRHAQYEREGWPILAKANDWFVGHIPQGDSMPVKGMEDLVEICIRDWPFILYGHYNRWTQFLNGEWRNYQQGLFGSAESRAMDIISQVKKFIPDTETAVRLIDVGTPSPQEHGLSKDGEKVVSPVAGKTENGRTWQVVIGAFSGVITSWFVSSALTFGLQSSFPPEDTQGWSLIAWGDHWIMHLIVSLISTISGGFVAGVAVYQSPAIAGGLSAVPTAGLYLYASILYLTSQQGLADSLGFGSGIAIVLIVVASIPVASIAASNGAIWKRENADLFGQRGRPLGMHWSTYLWIWLPLFVLIADISQTFLYLVHLWLGVETTFKVMLIRLLFMAAFFLTIGAFALLLHHAVKAETQKIPRGKRVGGIVLSILVLPVISLGLKFLAGFLADSDLSTPAWLEFFIAIIERRTF